MPKNDPAKTIRVEIGIWYNETDGKIRISVPSVPSFKLTTVNCDPGSRRGHPHLYETLAQLLRDRGVSAPLEPDNS